MWRLQLRFLRDSSVVDDNKVKRFCMSVVYIIYIFLWCDAIFDHDFLHSYDINYTPDGLKLWCETKSAQRSYILVETSDKKDKIQHSLTHESLL